MSLHFFSIPVANPQPFQDELNQFLATHRITAVERRWMDAGEASRWAVCVEVAHGLGPLPTAVTSAAKPAATGKVDYREVLSPEDFEVYARLRSLRKAISERDGCPAFHVFTNEQLAEMVQRRVTTRSALASIAGVGPARMERYAVEFLPPLSESFASSAVAHPPATATGA